MQIKAYSGQKFRFDISSISSILEALIDSSENEVSSEKLAEEFGMGKPKIDSLIQYMKVADLIDDKKLPTNFGKTILKVKNNYDIAQSLLYYKLCRGWENGGHFYFSKLSNNILFDIAFKANNVISNEEIKEKSLKFKDEMASVKEDDYKGHIIRAATALSDENDGFGGLGILKKLKKDEYAVNYFKPHPLVAAYIIYDRWPEGVSVVDFDYVIYGDYHLRRIFNLLPEDVYGIFAYLDQEELLKIEEKAGLRQIVKNPKVTKESILEEIINAV